MTRTTLDGTFEACLAGAAAAGAVIFGISLERVALEGMSLDAMSEVMASVETTGELGGVRGDRASVVSANTGIGS
jgi:hypothetical protein